MERSQPGLSALCRHFSVKVSYLSLSIFSSRSSTVLFHLWEQWNKHWASKQPMTHFFTSLWLVHHDRKAEQHHMNGQTLSTVEHQVHEMSSVIHNGSSLCLIVSSYVQFPFSYVPKLIITLNHIICITLLLTSHYYITLFFKHTINRSSWWKHMLYCSWPGYQFLNTNLICCFLDWMVWSIFALFSSTAFLLMHYLPAPTFFFFLNCQRFLSQFSMPVKRI